MGAPYSGRNLYAKFGDTVLSGRYKSFSETDEVAVIDKTCYGDTMRNWIVAPVDGSLAIEVLQEENGKAAWDALEVGSEGTLEWAPEGLGAGALYAIDARVKSRKRSVIFDDVVKMLFEFAYFSAPGTVTGGGVSDTGQPIGLLLALTRA